jgi:hypothetical protein
MQRQKGKKTLLRTHGRMVIQNPMASMAGMSMVFDIRLIHLGHIRILHHPSEYRILCFRLAKISPVSASSASEGVI